MKWLRVIGVLIALYLLLITLDDVVFASNIGNPQTIDGNNAFDNCQAALLNALPAAVLDDSAQYSLKVTQGEAEKTSVETVAQYYSWNIHKVGFNKDPIALNLSDENLAKTNTVWGYITSVTDNSPNEASKFAIVYIDANTGKPVSLVKEITVNNPNLDCASDGQIYLSPVVKLASYISFLALLGVSQLGWRTYNRRGKSL